MKKLYILLFTILITSLSFSQNVAVNGNMESWTGGVLDAWSSESGTTITEEITIVAEGSSAGNFLLTTQTQGDTDFRQSVNVTAGNTYDVSVQVYHLDNKSQARLYAGDYRGYSDENLTDQWQTITYQYVATTSGSVEFGLRFYDVFANWDTSSTIIIDDYQIIESTPPSSCFNLSTGPDSFELVNVITNSDGDTWVNNSGTYSMNGYCGSSCAEQVDQWLIFGPLDLTAVTDLSLSFNAAEQFGVTDLVIAYTNSYSGCPDSTSWTTAQTITDPGTINVDLSGASGTTVFIGIQYADDGTDSYSDWDLSNVILDASSCPTLGTPPVSDCGTCDIIFGTESFICASNTAGDNNDGVTVEIPYTGSETVGTLSTTSGGSITGDISVADGTITITDLSEGDAWDITINGGDCDGTTISGTVPSALCDPVTTDLVINEILADPDGTTGDANGDVTVDTSQDEFVELYNIGSTPLDISGFTIEDAVATRHTFPASTVIPPNSFITVFGGGTPTGFTGITQISSSGFLGLNNGGDTVTIKNGSGNVVVTYTYGAEGGDNQSLAREPDFTGAFVKHLSHSTNPVMFSPDAKNDGTTLSNNEIAFNELSIYPNPTNLGYVNISSKNSAKMDVAVFDILGKQVLNKTVNNNTLDVSGLTSGIYIMKVSQDNAISTKKLVIQ